MADRTHRMIGMAAVAVVVTGVIGWRSLRAGSAAAAPAVAPPNPGLAQLMPYAAASADSTRSFAIASDSVVLRRDPFLAQQVAAASGPQVRPAGTPVSEEPKPRVEAEVWHVTTTLVSGNRRAALINDALIYVGDPLPDGSKLTKVEHDHVVVTDQKGAAHTVAVAKENNG